jgi:hypothetical protein
MGFVKHSTVPLEVVDSDDKAPDWVKSASKEQEEERKRLQEEMKNALLPNED